MSRKYTQFYSLHTVKKQQFTGNVELNRLLEAGDFGIGTFNDTNGELIAIGGEIYRTCHDGSAEKITDFSEKTPYSIMTKFFPDETHNISQHLNMDEAYSYFDSLITRPDHIHAVAINATFKKICTRAPKPQKPPYKDLQTLISEQKESHFENIEGTIVGFYTPDYLSALGVPGYHLHFIDNARQHGGHVKSFNLEQADFHIQLLDEISVINPGGDQHINHKSRKAA
ncbi:Alpha-acetolactate decarboxylase [hydrothermal vent metagenome]|uniref:Alpha-acetolactate decarboxylase n=1 Tax=hydrothermal vent metagenome TaxID=652676 RepID=A0A3B0WQX1_9ZZZZ